MTDPLGVSGFLAPAPDKASPGTFTSHAHFDGSGNEYFEIAFTNTVLTLLTLGLYAAWAKIRTYQYFYSSTQLGGAAFRFTGAAPALSKGILIGAGVVGLLQLAFGGFMAFADDPFEVWGLLVGYLALLCYLWHYAYFRSRRYRFAHTTHREIRFHLEGSASAFAWRCFLRLLGTVLTLGLLFPAYKNSINRYVYNRLSFGNLGFHYDGTDAEYFRLCVPGFLLSVLTLGVYSFWWYPRLYTYRIDHLHVGQSRLRTAAIGPVELFRLWVPNLLMTVFSLGIASPLARVRSARFFVDRLRFEGPLDLGTVVQTWQQSASALGEGLAGALDMDVDLGL